MDKYRPLDWTTPYKRLTCKVKFHSPVVYWVYQEAPVVGLHGDRAQPVSHSNIQSRRNYADPAFHFLPAHLPNCDQETQQEINVDPCGISNKSTSLAVKYKTFFHSLIILHLLQLNHERTSSPFLDFPMEAVPVNAVWLLVVQFTRSPVGWLSCCNWFDGGTQYSWNDLWHVVQGTFASSAWHFQQNLSRPECKKINCYFIISTQRNMAKRKTSNYLKDQQNKLTIETAEFDYLPIVALRHFYGDWQSWPLSFGRWPFLRWWGAGRGYGCSSWRWHFALGWFSRP